MALKQNLALNLFNNNFISSHLNVNDFFFTQLSCTSKCGSATVNKLITNTKTLFFFFGRGVGGVGLIHWPVEGLVTVQFAPSPWEVWMGQAAAVCHTNLCSHPTWKCPAGEVSWNKQHNNSIIYLSGHIFPNEKKLLIKVQNHIQIWF